MHNVTTHDGAKIPVLGFRISEAEVEIVVPAALDAEFRHF